MVKKRNIARLAISAVPVLVICAALIYIITRLGLTLISDYRWYENIFAVALLFAELFILIHGIGYFMQILRIAFRSGAFTSQHREVPPLKNTPPVGVIVPAYKEDIDILRETLSTLATLQYPNVHAFLLDDTPYEDAQKSADISPDYKSSIESLCEEFDIHLFRHRWRGAKAGIINDFSDYLAGDPREGSRLDYQGENEIPDELKYLIVFDADQQPLPGFIKPLVARMEANEKLAFIQTPQYYTNFEENRVARAAGLQQAVFYEYICEGKSQSGAMFCCGTNIIFRLEALRDVGGMNEGSVTEDFATAIDFHSNGWLSEYYSQVLAFGTGPEDLEGYFKQQFRWAFGTISTFKKLVKKLFTNPSSLPVSLWWEYTLSGTYYWIGLVFLILMTCPVIYLFFNIPTYFASPEIYILVFLPYIVITLGVFFVTLKQRQYSILDIISGQLLIAITFPVYIKAAISALLGRKTGFVVTPKGKAGLFSLRDSWPQLLMIALSFSALIWGANKIYYQQADVAPLAANMFWCFYHLFLLLTLFYFRRPEQKKREL